jgi:hypothetical protein
MSIPNFELPLLQGQKQQQQVDLFLFDSMASPLQQPVAAIEDGQQKQQQQQVAGSKEIDQFFPSPPLPPNRVAATTAATAAIPDVLVGIGGATSKPKQQQRQRPPVPRPQRGGGGGGGFLEPRPPSPLSSVSHPSAPMGFPVVKDWGDWNQDTKNSIRDFFLKEFKSLELGKEVHDCLPEILDYVIDRLPSFIATYFRDAYVLLCRRELQIVLHVMLHVYRKNQKGRSSQGKHQEQYDKFDFLNNFVNFNVETDQRYYTAILFFLLLLRIMYNFMNIIRFDFGNNKNIKPESKRSTTKFSIQPVPMHTVNYYHLIIFTYCFLWAIENYHGVIQSHIVKQKLDDFIKQTTGTITPKLLHQYFKIRQSIGSGGGGGAQQQRQRGDSACHTIRISAKSRMTLYDYILITGMYLHRIQFINNDLFNLLVDPTLRSRNAQLYEGLFGIPYVPITDDRFFDIPLVPYPYTVIFEKIEPIFKAYSSRRPQSQRLEKRLKL